MKLSKMKKEDLELYSYDELTKLILEEETKPLNTQAIFKKICDLLELSDEEYTDKIGDFYTTLTTDKDFVLLADGNWDLRDHHPASTNFTDDEETYSEEDLEDIYEQLDVMINQYTTFTIDSLAELNTLIDNFGLTIKANTTLKNIRKSESELIEKINKMLDHLEDTIKLQIQNTSVMIYIVEDL